MPPRTFERSRRAASAPFSGVYRRRQPETTVLHAVVRENLETFLADGRSRGDGVIPSSSDGCSSTNPGSRTPPHSARTLLTTSTTATGAPFLSYSFLCAQEHRFEQFSSDFTIWGFFYGPRGGEAPLRDSV